MDFFQHIFFISQDIGKNKRGIKDIPIIRYQNNLQAATIDTKISAHLYLQIFVVLRYEHLKFSVF